MKCLLFLPFIITSLLCVQSIELRAQKSSNGLAIDDISTKAGIVAPSDIDSVDTDLVLGPVMTPGWEYRYARDTPEQFMQSGMFASIYGLGAESTFSPAGSPFYGNLFMTWMGEADQRIDNSRFILWNGLTVGLQTFFHSPSDYSSGDFNASSSASGIDRTQFYGRIGPGIGIMNVARVDGGTVENYLGIHTAASLGGFRNVGRRGALYVEMTGLFGYFPTLNKMNLIATPKLSIGFMFIRHQVPVYRY